MLDDYKDEQKIAYKMMINAVKNNRSSHAYLIEANGYPRQLNIALDFSKYLLCPYSYSNRDKCNGCNQCQRIDDGNFTELKIIEPDGMWIKKEQLKELQIEFSEKAIDANKKIYIINHADRMNESSANSILKFLEEPESNIIAILLTDNIYQMIPTIVSRCQIISLKKITNHDDRTKYNCDDETLFNIASFLFNSSDEIATYIQDENSVNEIDNVIKFINYFEQNKLDTLLKTNKLWHQFFKDKESSSRGYDIMLLFYKDVLNYTLRNKIENMNKYNNDIIKVSKTNTINSLSAKIKNISIAKDKLKNNGNLTLVLDKLIINMERDG